MIERKAISVSLTPELHAFVCDLAGTGARGSVSEELRDTLWMAATSAALHTTSRFASFYRRLRTAGKPHKLAITAVIRKLVVTLNAIVRDNSIFVH